MTLRMNGYNTKGVVFHGKPPSGPVQPKLPNPIGEAKAQIKYSGAGQIIASFKPQVYIQELFS